MTDASAQAIQAFRGGDVVRARRLSEQALAAARDDGDEAAEIDALCMLARVAIREGDVAAGRALADEAWTRADGRSRLERTPLHIQAGTAQLLGRTEEARRLFGQSIALNRSLGDERRVAGELHNLGYVELHDGQLERARELFAEASAQALRISDDSLYPCLVIGRAVLAARDGDSARAARLAGTAAAAYEARGEVPDPDDAGELARLRTEMTDALGPERAGALEREGRSSSARDVL